METTVGTDYFGVELKHCYFNEFILCGLPVPLYTNHSGFILKFKNPECYLSYRNLLEIILSELDQADPKDFNYEIHRSKAFIKNILTILKEQHSKKYN